MAPPPAALGSTSPVFPLLGHQSGKMVTPLDVGRFQSRVFRSVLDQMKSPREEPGEESRIPGVNIYILSNATYKEYIC